MRICARCGTCCKKGGPAFHLEDKKLIENGAIPSKFLFTIREGEPSYDNVKEVFFTALSDIIKIKPGTDFSSCIFYRDDKGCEIYEKRPSECKVLKCWDTSEIEELYNRDRLTRKELLNNVEGLWDLVLDHQIRCSYNKLKTFADDLNGGETKDALSGISDILFYDKHIRKVVMEKTGIDSEMIDFIFGRPMIKAVSAFGLKIEEKNGKLVVCKDRPELVCGD